MIKTIDVHAHILAEETMRLVARVLGSESDKAKSLNSVPLTLLGEV